MKYAEPIDRLIANSILEACGCWRWTGHYHQASHDLRPYLTVRIDGEPRGIPVTRYIVQFVHGIRWTKSKRKVGAHECHNAWCVHSNHVIYSTQKENVAQNIARGVHHVFVRRKITPSRGSDLIERVEI